MKRYKREFGARALLFGLFLLVTGTCGSLRAQEPSALFWSISKNGQAAGFLLGTIHSEDPRVLDFQESFSEDLLSNTFFAMEIVPDLPTLSRLTQFMQYQDGRTLEGQVGSDRYALLKPLLAKYKIPADWVSKMKVWAVMMTLSVPPPQTGLFMDFSLSLRAAGAGLKVVGLETLEEQLSFLETMSLEQQLALLDQAMAEQAKSGEIHAQMVDSYLAGDTAALQATAEEQLDQLDDATRRHFVERGVKQRNQRMIETLLPLLQQGKVFTAVGALHLPGEKGLIRLLQDQGYDLFPLPLPLIDAAPESALQSRR
jgi:uncharacterized protein YbaP (TraB family)